jgi:GDP-L-fucose synthase
MANEQVLDYFSDTHPDVVIHLAARVGGIQANVSQPASFLLDNVQIDTNVLRAVSRYKPEHVIVMLSTCMYPDRLDDVAYPMDEDQIEDGPPPSTNASYAAAKRTLLHGVKALHAQYDTPYTALIPSNLYGPNDHFHSKASHFIAAAISKIERARRDDLDSVEFFGTGAALRQFLYVQDLARLIGRVVEQGPANRQFNVAPRHNLSIRELALAVVGASGYGGEVSFSGEGPDGQLRKDVTSAELTRWIPEWPEMETDLHSGLTKTIDWYRANVASR